MADSAGSQSDRNITWYSGLVSADDRRALLGQRGCVVWLTGLSGSGKSTIAHGLERRRLSGTRISGAWAKWRL
jgi:adenylylsulfate kinase